MANHRSTTIGPEAKALIYKLYRFGYSVAQIAKRLGGLSQTVLIFNFGQSFEVSITYALKLSRLV